jgi:hypothetical protein
LRSGSRPTFRHGRRHQSIPAGLPKDAPGPALTDARTPLLAEGGGCPKTPAIIYENLCMLRRPPLHSDAGPRARGALVRGRIERLRLRRASAIRHPPQSRLPDGSSGSEPSTVCRLSCAGGAEVRKIP